MTSYQLGLEVGYEHAAGDTDRWHDFRQGSQEHRDFQRGYSAATRNT
jgi:hypothetical protein